MEWPHADLGRLFADVGPVVELPRFAGLTYRDERGERCPTGEARDERYHVPSEQRLAVLRIKDVWHRPPSYPDEVSGWEIYTAVLGDGVRTPEQFGRWLVANGFATEVEFPAASCDAVVCLYTLIHLPLDEQPALLVRVGRWLRPDGWLLATGTEDHWLGGDTPIWWSHADAATYRTWIEQAGLSIVTQDVVPEGDGAHALFWARQVTARCGGSS